MKKKIDRSCNTCADKCGQPYGEEYNCPGHKTAQEVKNKRKSHKRKK